MPENHSRVGKRVERIEVTDEPHERYRGFNPWTGEELAGNGIPILTTTAIGHVIEKEVTNKVVKCPECNIPAEYNYKSEPICPDCGIVCSDGDASNVKIVRDAKAAGRINGDADTTST